MTGRRRFPAGLAGGVGRRPADVHPGFGWTFLLVGRNLGMRCASNSQGLNTETRRHGGTEKRRTYEPPRRGGAERYWIELINGVWLDVTDWARASVVG